MSFWLPLMLLILIPAPALATGVLRIPAEVAVEGRTITMGEIAMLDGLSPTEHRQVSGLSLGPSALPAHHREFSGQALRERVAALKLELVIDIPERVRVHTAYRDIEPEYLRKRLEQAIRLRMPWPESAVKFSRWRLPPRFAVPTQAQRLEIEFRRNEDFLGRLTAQLELRDALDSESRRFKRTASVEIDVRGPVVVTTRRLRRGMTLEADAIRLEERDLRMLARDRLTSIPQALGQRMKRNAAQGTPLRFSHLASEPLVRRGDVLVVGIENPGIDVHIQARALEPGAMGQIIRAENPSSRRKLHVEVTGAGTARLHLPGVGRRP